MSIDDGCDCAGQIAVGLDLVQFAGFYERCEHGPVLCASVVTREECVLSLQRNGVDCAFNSVAVHLDAAIIKEQDQAAPIFGDVFEGLSRGGFSGYLRAGIIKPGFKGCYLWRAFGLTQYKSIFGRFATRLRFDPIKGCYLFETFLGDGCHVVMCQFIKSAAGMGPAISQLDRFIVP